MRYRASEFEHIAVDSLMWLAELTYNFLRSPQYVLGSVEEMVWSFSPDTYSAKRVQIPLRL